MVIFSFVYLFKRKGDLVANYEEMYYSARRSYRNALEEKSSIQRKSSQLQSRKSYVLKEIAGKKSELSKVNGKIQLLQDAESKCSAIFRDDFPTMKKSVQTLSSELKKIISSDSGVADLASVYASDLQSTQTDLGTILMELSSNRKSLETQRDSLQSSLNEKNGELNGINREINGLGSEWQAQQKANRYYAQMKEYERRWRNGE